MRQWPRGVIDIGQILLRLGLSRVPRIPRTDENTTKHGGGGGGGKRTLRGHTDLRRSTTAAQDCL